ncbi:hypothetical protein os1_41560 [Comamonadaceae bacterium OS-1]|nr:hypothetical protein os1_41560 [Comamonadaceae bacterium OS-1]
MRLHFTTTAGLLGLALLTGCATKVPTLYQWGSYQDQIYTQYAEPGKVPVDAQIAAMEADLQKTDLQARKPPPGYLAQLGYLYFQAGKPGQAVQSFEAEKSLFPESTVYMDLLIQHAKK